MNEDEFYNEYCHGGYQLKKNDSGSVEVWIGNQKVFNDMPKPLLIKDGKERPESITQIGLDGFCYRIDFLHDGTMYGLYQIRSD